MDTPDRPVTPSPTPLPPHTILPSPVLLSSPAPAAAPLGEAHYLQVRQAAQTRRAVRSAGRVARNSAVITLGIGVVSLLLTAMFFSVVGLAVSAGVCVVGVVELVGAGRMRRADPSAARMLGMNQLAFFGLITAYCVFQMATFSAKGVARSLQSSGLFEQLSGLGDTGEGDTGQGLGSDIVQSLPPMVYVFFGLTIVLSAGFQGGLAVYYFTRQKGVLAYRAGTPAWIQRLFVELDM